MTSGTGRIADLAGVDVESGVSARTGRGFCTITARDTAGHAIGVGQLDPQEARRMALQWLAAAEAAESDAAVFAELRKTGAGPDVCLAFVGSLRQTRQDLHPEADE